MIIILPFLFFFVTFGAKNELANLNYLIGESKSNELSDPTEVDEKWMGYMITAPATINILAQVMVVASKVDVSFENYSPNHVYQYIKYPKSFRATLLQISNEGYQAFLNAHSSMNRIQLYMRQSPGHVKTILKTLKSKISNRLAVRVLSQSTSNIERIGKTCLELALGVNNSFTSVMNLLGEVIEITQVTQGLSEEKKRLIESDLHITNQLLEDTKKMEKERRQRYEQIRKTVDKAQEEYSNALKAIPTGWKAIGLEFGRAFSSLFGLLSRKSSSSSSIQSSGSDSQSVSTELIINIASRFSESLDKLITKLPSNENETVNEKELEAYKTMIGTFFNLANSIEKNDRKDQVTGLIQQTSDILGRAIKDKTVNIKTELESASNKIKPFMVAEKISKSNTAPIQVTAPADSSQNEMLIARMAQAQLNNEEKRLDQYAAEHAKTMEKVHELSTKLSQLNFTDIRYGEIIEMLKEAFKLLGELRRQWGQLVLFFSDFADRAKAGFNERLKNFLQKVELKDDMETSIVNRKFVLNLLNGDSNSLNYEADLLYTVSHTYFEASREYLMPRLASLSLMLAASSDGERKQLVQKLNADTMEVQSQIKELINTKIDNYKTKIREALATVNQKIDEEGEDGEDGIEQEIIKQGKNIIAGKSDTRKKKKNNIQQEDSEEENLFKK